MMDPTASARETVTRVARRATAKLATFTTPRRALAAVSSLVAISLTGVGGTAALWTGSVTVDAPAVTAGSIVADVSDLSALNHTYTSNALSKTAFMQVTNGGTVDASYVFTVAPGSGGNATMAANTSLAFWFTGSAASCTEHEPVGDPGRSGMLDAVPSFSGSLPAGYSGGMCVRTRMDADLLTSTATIVPVLKLDLSIPGTGWSSSDTATATQVVSATAAVGNDYTDAVRADGAQHYWRLGESAGQVFYDLAGTADAYAGTGIVRGSESALVGDPNLSTTFPNTASGMAGTRVPESSQNAFAVEAWFKTSSTTGGKIVGFGSATTGLSGSYDRHLYLDASGRITFGVYPGMQKKLTSAAGFNNGAWHHVVGNLGPNGQELYVDGVRVAHDATVTNAQAYSGYWRIGGDSTWDVDPYFDGLIDEVAVYADPLTARQAGTHYNLSGRGAYPAGTGDRYGSTVYSDSPTLYWRLGESSGTTAADSSGNGNTGRYTGDVTKGVSGAVPGTRNAAASFGGTNGLVASEAQFANPQSYSLELWFKTTSTTGGKLVGFGNAQTGDSGEYDRHIYLRNDGRVVFGSYPGSTQTAASTAAYNNGQWHHVVATQSSSGMALYIDGQRVGTNSATTPQNYVGYWRVGGDNLTSWPDAPTSRYVSAVLDEVAIYPTALSSTRVQHHYASATGAPIAAFTASMSQVNGTFDAGPSSDLDGSLASYTWNWGDGSAHTTGLTATKNYTTPGTYTVTLTVTDDSGKQSATSLQVTAADTTAPSTPTAPTVTGNTGTTVSLAWAASSDNLAVTEYEIFRDGVQIGTATGTSYTNSGLSTDTTYSYTVRARDGAGNRSALSPATSIRTHPVDTAAWFEIRNATNGHCIVTGTPYADRPLSQGPCATPSTSSQAFRFTPAAGGKLSVVFRADTAYAWSPPSAGASILLSRYTGGTGQHWMPEKQSDGTFRIIAEDGKCLDYQNTSPGSTWTPITAVCSATSGSQRVNLVVVQ